MLKSLNYCNCIVNYACHSLFMHTHKCIIQCAKMMVPIHTVFTLGEPLTFWNSSQMVNCQYWVTSLQTNKVFFFLFLWLNLSDHSPGTSLVNELTSILSFMLSYDSWSGVSGRTSTFQWWAGGSAWTAPPRLTDPAGKSKDTVNVALGQQIWLKFSPVVVSIEVNLLFNPKLCCYRL